MLTAWQPQIHARVYHFPVFGYNALNSDSKSLRSLKTSGVSRVFVPLPQPVVPRARAAVNKPVSALPLLCLATEDWYCPCLFGELRVRISEHFSYLPRNSMHFRGHVYQQITSLVHKFSNGTEAISKTVGARTATRRNSILRTKKYYAPHKM